MSTFQDAQTDSASLAKLVNEDTDVTTRYGAQPKKSIPKVLREFEEESNASLDSFNQESAESIAESIAEFDQVIDQYKESRGFNEKGTFAAGFTYELPNDVGLDASGNPWILIDTSSLPVVVTAGTTPTNPPYKQVAYGTAAQVSTNTSDTAQSFIDSFALKIFQSPTDGGLTEISTRTLLGGEVYEVRKVSDDSLANIYSDKEGLNPINQNGTSNVSGSDGVVDFYIADGDYYVSSGVNNTNFSTVLGTIIIDEPYLGIGETKQSIADRLTTSFNWARDYDNDAGSALTLAWDENLGSLNRVDLIIPDVTANDATAIALTEITDEFNCNQFRIVAELDGDDVDIEIYTQQLLDFNSNSQTLNAGQIATPIFFRQGAKQFLRVKKGIGEGKIGIDYQYQDPKTKLRGRQRIWVIDLDDGLAVRDYDLLLPQCSANTMNGQTKLGDSVSLNWVVESVSGTIHLVGEGINPQAGSVEQIYKETVLAADLPASGEWHSPKFTKKSINRLRFFLKQKEAGQSTTASNIKMEIEL